MLYIFFSQFEFYYLCAAQRRTAAVLQCIRSGKMAESGFDRRLFRCARRWQMNGQEYIERVRLITSSTTARGKHDALPRARKYYLGERLPPTFGVSMRAMTQKIGGKRNK